jgi:hypothetical protein
MQFRIVTARKNNQRKTGPDSGSCLQQAAEASANELLFAEPKPNRFTAQQRLSFFQAGAKHRRQPAMPQNGRQNLALFRIRKCDEHFNHVTHGIPFCRKNAVGEKSRCGTPAKNVLRARRRYLVRQA